MLKYANKPIRKRGFRLLGRKDKPLPETWIEDYMRGLQALSRLNTQKPSQARQAEQLERFLDRLEGEAVAAGRGRIFRPKPNQFGFYPDMRSLPVASIKTAIRANSPTHTRQTAWGQVGKSATPVAIAHGESVKMRKHNNLDALQQRHFMEAVAVGMPIGKGRHPHFLGQKVPGELNLGPTGTRTIIGGTQMTTQDWNQGFSPMRFQLPKKIEKKHKWSGRALTAGGLTSLGTLVGGWAETVGAINDQTKMKLDDISGIHGMDSGDLAAVLHPKNGDARKRAIITKDLISRTKKRVADWGMKHGRELPFRWRNPTHGWSVEKINARRGLVGLGMMGAGVIGLKAVGSLADARRKKINIEKRAHSKAHAKKEKFMTDLEPIHYEGEGLIKRVAKRIGGVGVGVGIGSIVAPALETPGFEKGFDRGNRGNPLDKTEAITNRFIPGYMPGYLQGRVSASNRKAIRKNSRKHYSAKDNIHGAVTAGKVAMLAGLGTVKLLGGTYFKGMRHGRKLQRGMDMFTRGKPTLGKLGLAAGAGAGVTALAMRKKQKQTASRKHYEMTKRVRKKDSVRTAQEVIGTGMKTTGRIVREWGVPVATLPAGMEVMHAVQDNNMRGLLNRGFAKKLALPLGVGLAAQALVSGGRRLHERAERKTKDVRVDNSVSAEEIQYYEWGFMESIRDHWNKFKENLAPTLTRGAFVGGLGKLHQEVGLPPTTVDGIPVVRRSISGSFAPFTNTQLEKVKRGLEKKMDRATDDKEKEVLQRNINDVIQEIAVRQELPST